MRILVCIKQVPSTTEVEIDPVTGVLKREGAKAKINPFDLFALEQAFCLREEYGGTVEVLSMGPPQAHAALQEALHLGADNACLLSDRRFAGADVVATSYTLAAGIKKMGQFDLILCGKQTTDGDTAQVGPEIAEFLGIPHASYVQTVELLEDGELIVQVHFGTYSVLQSMQMPCLLTMEKDVNTPRLPSYLRRLDTAGRTAVCYSLDDFADTDANNYGLAGSPTQVERIFPPEKNMQREIFTGMADDVAAKAYHVLKDNKYI